MSVIISYLFSGINGISGSLGFFGPRMPPGGGGMALPGGGGIPLPGGGGIPLPGIGGMLLPGTGGGGGGGKP